MRFMFLLTLPAVVSLALGLLTVRRTPSWLNWRLALLAGEFGWLLSVVPLLVGWTAWSENTVAPRSAALVLLLALPAAGLLLYPAGCGWWIGRTLKPALTQAFGAAPPRPASSPGPVQTHEYAPGRALDFYPVRRADGRPAPCVIMVHGGGWDAGDRTQLAGFNRRLARMGYAVAAISYRLAPKHPWPAQREDALAAVAWLKARAEELKIDANRLVLMGRSAGGQIAAAVGYLGDPAVRGVVSLYALHDMRFAWSVSREDDALNSRKLMQQFLGGPPEGREEIYDTASGQLLVAPGRTPPTLLVHGTIDTLVWVRHSRRLAARLAEAGVPRFLLELPWATHACEISNLGPAGRLTGRALRHFLAAVTQ